jgi:preprotein translocase subunit SecA
MSERVLAPVAPVDGLPPAPLPAPDKLPEGADILAHWVRGRWRRRSSHARRLARESRRCLAYCEQLAGLDEASFQERLEGARALVRSDPREAKGRLAEALAVVGEAAFRTRGMRPYVVQFMGALALHRGWLAEMATGEGKTLTASLAGVLAGWSGRATHVVTSNDYLAHRDAEEMSPLYARCGLTVASVVAAMKPEERLPSYRADVVYLTAKELLADFLRDQLAARAGQDPRRIALRRWLGTLAPDARAPQLLVRGLHNAIVDEADSVLIDEAVTPLILSAPRPALGLTEAVLLMKDVADQLQETRDYEVMRRTRTVRLRDGAREAAAAVASQLPAVWRMAPRREELLRQALTVRHLILPGHQYVIEEGEVVLLDEFTGRMTPGRTLTAGLHQAIEAREGVEVTDPNESLGQMSFQGFFRRFPRLSGTTGTGREAADEFWKIYRLGVMPIPTHRPRITRVSSPRLFRSAHAKWQAVAEQVARLHARGQPVLVGVRSVEASETIAALLTDRGLPFELLNAVRHAEEARIVARAGEPGRITIATNMAGRGTDIRLGEGVDRLGGLHVIVAEINESGRIDRQLAGRCGRQGDPGSVTVFLSLEDGLARRFLPAAARLLLAFASALRLPGRPALARALFRYAQRRAEADAFGRRRSVLKSDDWLDSALPFEAGP